jgi:recombination protein RecT
MVTNTKGDQVLERLKGKEDKQPATLQDWLGKMRPELEKALPKHVSPDRILRIALTTIRTNPKLRSCEPMSFIAALMQSAQLGLEPNTPLGEAYIIPYNSKGGMKAQFQIGYHGIITLAQNTGLYRSIYAHEVFENDDFSYELGLNKDLKHTPADEPEGEPIYFYACYHLLNGGYDFVVWSRNKIEKHRDQYSKAAKFPDSSWQTDFNAMAKKTVLIALLKYAPKSIELARQLAMDSTVKKEIAPDMTEVPAEEMEIDLEGTEIDRKTGEVKEEGKPEFKPKPFRKDYDPKETEEI